MSTSAHRVARLTYGAFGVLCRPNDGGKPADWSRFDTPGGRTLYCAESRECAFAESISVFKQPLGALAIGGAVEREWADLGYLPPGHLSPSWRTDRALYTLRLPDTGWWILLETPDSLAAIETALGQQLNALGATMITVATLRGEDRAVTTTIAAWARSQLVGDDAMPALGITYFSKHAAGQCWAYWMRATDDGMPVTAEAVMYEQVDRIAHNEPALVAVAARYGVVVH